MGQAKASNKEDRAAASAQARFQTAYDMLFDLVVDEYASSGQVQHRICGVNFEGGEVTTIDVLQVTENDQHRIPEGVEQLLARSPVVVHICEAWEAPPSASAEGDRVRPSLHPERREIAMFVLYSQSAVHAARSAIDPVARTLEKDTLLTLDGIGGRMARQAPVIH